MTLMTYDPKPSPRTNEASSMTKLKISPTRITRNAVASVSTLALIVVTTTAGFAQNAGRLVPIQPQEDLPSYAATLPEVTSGIASAFAEHGRSLTQAVAAHGACVASGRRSAQGDALATGALSQAAANERLTHATCDTEYHTQRITLARQLATTGLQAEEDLMAIAFGMRAEQARLARERDDALARAAAATRDLGSLRDLPPEIRRLAGVPQEVWTPAERRLVGDFRRLVLGLVRDQQAAEATAADLDRRIADQAALAVAIEGWAVGLGELARDQTLEVQSRQHAIAAIARGAERLAMTDLSTESMGPILVLLDQLSLGDGAFGVRLAEPLGSSHPFEPLAFEGTGQDDLGAVLELLGVHDLAEGQ